MFKLISKKICKEVDADYKDWDSLEYLLISMTLEQELDVAFDKVDFKNLGEMVDYATSLRNSGK